MDPKRAHVSAIEVDDSPAERIVRKTRELLPQLNYSGLTMDALAHELGMSKKTLYAHFSSKDAIVEAIIDRTGASIRARARDILSDASRAFPDQLRGVLELISNQLTILTPALARDLERFAPRLHRKINDLRERNVPEVFGRMLQLGASQGMVRADLDIPFIIEFWLHAIAGLSQPGSLQRTGLSPQSAFEKGVRLLCLGVLADKSRKNYR